MQYGNTKQQRMKFDDMPELEIVANKSTSEGFYHYEVGAMVNDHPVLLALRTNKAFADLEADEWWLTATYEHQITGKQLAKVATVLDQIDTNKFWWDAPATDEEEK